MSLRACGSMDSKKNSKEIEKDFWSAIGFVKKVKQKHAPKKEPITEFDDSDDWILSMILVALMHANPGMTPDQAIKRGREWAKNLYMPRMEHTWRKQAIRIERFGIRAEASKIRRELFKLI